MSNNRPEHAFSPQRSENHDIDPLACATVPLAILAAATPLGRSNPATNQVIEMPNGLKSRSAPWTNVYDPFVAMSFTAAHGAHWGRGLGIDYAVP